MAAINVNPLVLKDVIFSVGADSYEAALSSVVFTPSGSVVTWKGLTPESVHSSGTTATWTAELAYVQDWDSNDSLSAYLFDHEGEEVAVTFKPRSGTGPSFTATVIVTPGAIGGAVDTYGTATVSLGLKGKPQRIAGTPEAPTVLSANETGGPIAGGTLVEVVGHHFTGATAVHFGTVPATEFSAVGDQRIYVVAPAAAAGSKPIKVTNATGQSTTSAPYTYA